MKKSIPASKPLTPFFALKVADAPLVVRTGVRAGAAEQNCKSDTPRDCKQAPRRWCAQTDSSGVLLHGLAHRVLVPPPPAARSIGLDPHAKRGSVHGAPVHEVEGP